METFEKVKRFLELGHNIFLTGAAGTGKSYNLRKIIEWADEKNMNVARTAMTGMASLQLECGETLHKCMGLMTCTRLKDFDRVVNNYNFSDKTIHELKILDMIIIDEISMLRSDTLELCDAVLKHVNENDKPFGGIQVIFSGDFLQLPPIVKNEEKKLIPNPWAFQSDIWRELNLKIIYLTEIKRQDDYKFCTALNMVRAGCANTALDEYFLNTKNTNFPEKIKPVRLMSTNKEVEKTNNSELLKLKTPIEKYEAKVTGKSEKLKNKIIKDCTAMQFLNLKVGAQVMILINDSNRRYVNGSMGKYLGITKTNVGHGIFQESVKAVAVQLFDSGEEVVIPINMWKMEKRKEDGKIELEACFTQFPIKLAWAITIHKSQGMSIDYLDVNLSKCFAEGMAYVALSRARNYEGLRVLNWSKRAIFCNKDAFNFYMDLKKSGEI
jgi:ATP-dependent exoDNAse (exonuclease V) alpha subunit